MRTLSDSPSRRLRMPCEGWLDQRRRRWEVGGCGWKWVMASISGRGRLDGGWWGVSSGVEWMTEIRRLGGKRRAVGKASAVCCCVKV